MSEQHSITGSKSVNPDAEVFETLKSLLGSWEGTTEEGRVIRVTYSLHANDSVLMERWVGKKSDALTLYHMDSATLMATHYCPLGNQPRLVLRRKSPGDYAFEFHSATNLPDHGVAHQQSFEISLLGPDSFWRSESYIEAGTSESEGVTYHRVE